jgi:hypothetical protein
LKFDLKYFFISDSFIVESVRLIVFLIALKLPNILRIKISPCVLELLKKDEKRKLKENFIGFYNIMDSMPIITRKTLKKTLP